MRKRSRPVGELPRPLRILVLTQYFWPEDFRITDLAVALKERSHDVVVLTGLPNYPAGRLFPGYGLRGPWSETIEGGVPVVRVPLIPRGVGKGWRLAVNFASFALAATTLGPARIKGDIDVIFVYEPSPITSVLPAVAFRRLRRAPLVLWVQDVWPDILPATGAVSSTQVLESVAWLTRWVYRHCDRVLAQSRSFVPRIEAQGVAPERLAYVPNWAEALYRPVELAADAAERRELPEGFCVLFAGNIGVSQSFETILAAAERLRHEAGVHWVVLGDGRQKAWVQREIDRRGLQSTVHLLGRRPVESMPRYFSAADVLLVSLRGDPLYTWTVPSKLQSYMACAKPIVAALDGEGARIVEESGAGVVTGAESPERLADAVLALSRAGAEELAALGRNGRRYYDGHFTRERVVTEIEKILYEAVEAG